MPPEGTLSPDIQAAVDLAERSDVAVVMAGLWEGESRDRGELDLPTDQDELIDGIVQLYYGGQEQGRALADVLFGDVNPPGSYRSPTRGSTPNPWPWASTTRS